MATRDEKSFLRTLLRPAVRDGGQGLRSLFAKIGAQNPSGVDDHQGAADWNPVMAAVLGTQPTDDTDPANDTDPTDAAPSA